MQPLNCGGLARRHIEGRLLRSILHLARELQRLSPNLKDPPLSLQRLTYSGVITNHHEMCDTHLGPILIQDERQGRHHVRQAQQRRVLQDVEGRRPARQHQAVDAGDPGDPAPHGAVYLGAELEVAVHNGLRVLVPDAEPLSRDSEVTPLIRGRGVSNTSPTKPPSLHDQSWTCRFQAREPRAILLLCAGVIFALSLCSDLAEIPMVRLMEDAICQDFYHHSLADPRDGGEKTDPIDEGLCKVEEIQSRLAWLGGFVALLDAAVGLLVAFPFGVLADRIGRKPVLVAAVLGTFMSMTWIVMVLLLAPTTLPVQLVMVNPAFRLIGGGSAVVVAMVYAVVADVESEASRAFAFFIMAFGGLAGSMIGPLAASWIMQRWSPWVAIWAAFTTLPPTLLAITLIPETLRCAGGAGDAGSTEHHDDLDDDHSSILDVGNNGVRALVKPVEAHPRISLRELKASLSLLDSSVVVIVLLSFLTQMPVALATGQTFIQYISIRFEWNLADTGYLLSARGVINTILLLLLLPALTRLLHRRGFSSQRTELTIARSSALFLALGSLLLAGPEIGVAVAGLVVLTFGSGLNPSCRSLLASLVDAKHASQMFSLVGIVETVGSLISAPALAWLFSQGMALSGPWVGLPYFGLAALCGTTAALMFVRLKREHPLNTSSTAETMENAEP